MSNAAIASLRLAGIRRRLACIVYECIVISAMLLLAAFAFHTIVKPAAPQDQSRLIFQAYLFLTLGVYYCWHWTSVGQTLPMKTWRLRVVTTSGKLLGGGQAQLRYLLAWLSLLSFGLGFVWAFFDADGQFLHDRLLRTRIVHTDDQKRGHIHTPG